MTRQLIGAEEVAEITGMSKSYSFKLIKTLNAELAAQDHPREGPALVFRGTPSLHPF